MVIRILWPIRNRWVIQLIIPTHLTPHAETSNIDIQSFIHSDRTFMFIILVNLFDVLKLETPFYLFRKLWIVNYQWKYLFSLFRASRSGTWISRGKQRVSPRWGSLMAWWSPVINYGLVSTTSDQSRGPSTLPWLRLMIRRFTSTILSLLNLLITRCSPMSRVITTRFNAPIVSRMLIWGTPMNNVRVSLIFIFTYTFSYNTNYLLFVIMVTKFFIELLVPIVLWFL